MSPKFASARKFISCGPFVLLRLGLAIVFLFIIGDKRVNIPAVSNSIPSLIFKHFEKPKSILNVGFTISYFFVVEKTNIVLKRLFKEIFYF